MLKKLWKWTVLNLIFINGQAFSEQVQWVNTENASSFSIGWATPGDFFSVNVLVDGHAPFTCSMMTVTLPVISLGENGECDIRSSSLDGEITIEVSGFNESGDLLGKEELTLIKDTILPEISEQNGKLLFYDKHLDLDSIHCTLNDEPLPDCTTPQKSAGILRAKAADFAGNHAFVEIEIK